MQIKLTNIGKRFNLDWIFRDIDYIFSSDHAYVIQGFNGSGKSTLLQTICGNVLPTKGNIEYRINDTLIPIENVFRHVSIAAPYLELIEELTLFETIKFHGKFKAYIDNISLKEIVERVGLGDSGNKQIKHFSSGMKQRVKLALAILSDTDLLLLDEPLSNLDKRTTKWYNKMIQDFRRDRLIIVCSNQYEEEYSFCDSHVKIEDYK